jgi:hypothetical protein
MVYPLRDDAVTLDNAHTKKTGRKNSDSALPEAKSPRPVRLHTPINAAVIWSATFPGGQLHQLASDRVRERSAGPVRPAGR